MAKLITRTEDGGLRLHLMAGYGADFFRRTSQEYKAGYRNPQTGAGTAADKSEGGYWQPTTFASAVGLFIIYNESWAAGKFIDIPIDDALAKWREWVGVDAETTKKLTEVEERLKVRDALERLGKAGRLYGTAIALMLTENDQTDSPFDADRYKPGSLKGLPIFDRYDVSIDTDDVDKDIYSGRYGLPNLYQVTSPFSGEKFKVHHTRVLRFDGRKPLTNRPSTAYDPHFGISALNRVLLSIKQDAEGAKSLAHMMVEASIKVLKIPGFRRYLASMQDFSVADGDIDPDAYGRRITQDISNFRTAFMDKDTDFARVAVMFGGVADVLDRFHKRLAAAADIPYPRFMSESPSGLQSTGKGEAENYQLMLQGVQRNGYDPIMTQLDPIIAAEAGVELPEYRWLSILDLSESELLDITEKKVKVLSDAKDAGFLYEDEGRKQLSGDPNIGELDEERFELPEPTPEPTPQVVIDPEILQRQNGANGANGAGQPQPAEAEAAS